MTRTDPAATGMIDALDSFYCYNIAAARRLADRIGDLGGAITADPCQLLDRSPGTEEFTLPDCSDVASIGEYGLQRLNIIIAAYEAFLDKVRGTDDVSFHLVLELLAAETTSAPTSRPHSRVAVDPTRTTVTGWPEKAKDSADDARGPRHVRRSTVSLPRHRGRPSPRRPDQASCLPGGTHATSAIENKQ